MSASWTRSASHGHHGWRGLGLGRIRAQYRAVRGKLAGTYVGASGTIGVGVGVAVSIVQTATDNLHNAVAACKVEITGVCGNTIPGQGRIAACLIADKSAASKDCADAIKTVETIATQ
jgi:hypothetical protein